LAARGVGTKPRRLRRGVPYKSKTENAVTIEGKVVKVNAPKQYPITYGRGGYVEKYYLETVDANGTYHKAMVYTLSDRERPFRGDSVRYTTQPEKDGWGSVTERQDFEVLNHEGKEEWIRWKREQEAKEEAERKAREEEQRRRDAEERLRRQQEYQRGRELEQKWEKSFRRAVGDYGADLIEDIDFSRDMTERVLKDVSRQAQRGYEEERTYHAFVGAGLLSLRPGRETHDDRYYLTEDGRKILAQMEAGRL